MSDELTMRATSDSNPALARALNLAMTGNEQGGRMEAATATPLRQLTFDVGGDAREERLEGTVSVSGKLEVGRDLMRQDSVEVHLVGPGGELLARADAVVSKIAFVDHEKDGVEWVERVHTVKIEDAQ